MDEGLNAAANQELVKAEMFAAALRGQVHAGGAAVAGGQMAEASGLQANDSVEISDAAYQLAASAGADTE